MKKMKLLAGLLFGLLCVVKVGTVSAQNLQGRFDAYNIGSPDYTANSGGSFYGQLFSSVSTGTWTLGFGSSQGTSGTGVLSWNSNGHVLMNGVAAPIVSSCGTTPSLAAGSDNAGDVQMGGNQTGVTTCTLTFSTNYDKTPHCFINNRTSKLGALAQPTQTSLVIVGTGAGAFANAGDVVDYVCFGH